MADINLTIQKLVARGKSGDLTFIGEFIWRNYLGNRNEILDDLACILKNKSPTPFKIYTLMRFTEFLRSRNAISHENFVAVQSALIELMNKPPKKEIVSDSEFAKQIQGQQVLGDINDVKRLIYKWGDPLTKRQISTAQTKEEVLQIVQRLKGAEYLQSIVNLLVFPDFMSELLQQWQEHESDRAKLQNIQKLDAFQKEESAKTFGPIGPAPPPPKSPTPSELKNEALFNIQSMIPK
ncbi:MAG: hypothetical protein ABIK73_08450 [candidate division WOR-3 bacterium]